MTRKQLEPHLQDIVWRLDEVFEVLDKTDLFPGD